MNLIKMFWRHRLVVGYSVLCMLVVATGLLDQFAPQSEIADHARIAALSGAATGLVHLAVRAVGQVIQKFEARIVERVKGTGL
ncbi:hypothetical protein P8A22_10300 [Streptomyces laculatispora]|uniref:Uncharacterized protein n=1 Tax=Streptomyces laculatispora TaxID=887464 RepID=A0ABY9I170_9ACTN|nr:hypothetical protein [Streptomyces laculatispora]WLQ40354.1 hypothetical protein P8A22_10300 [Streptomyces laculatispora]